MCVCVCVVSVYEYVRMYIYGALKSSTSPDFSIKAHLSFFCIGLTCTEIKIIL